MESPPNKLTSYEREFFTNLRNYIDKPIYFYGSIQRNDYLPGRSDVDIAIFTDNEISTLILLGNFLNLDKKEFRKSIYNLNNKIIPGFKGKYKNKSKNMQIEISIYNEKYKNIIIQEHARNYYLPIYISLPLIIIKYLYYDLKIITKNLYKNLKCLLLNENGQMKFILLDND